MRIPATKVWRAFPELDQYDDAACLRYTSEARRRHRVSGILLGATAVPIALLAGLIGINVSWALTDAMIPGGADPSPLQWAASVVFFLVPPLAIAACLLLVRDAWLRLAVRARLNTMVCTKCRYSLLGLEARQRWGEEFFVCPECGQRIAISSEMREQIAQLAGVTPSAPASP